MASEAYELNRVVHLARCAVFFEMSATRVSTTLKLDDEQQRVADLDVCVYFTQSALDHAVLASKSEHATTQERAFVSYLQLVLSYLQAARALMEVEPELLDDNSSLWRFLNQPPASAVPLKFARNSQQLLQDAARLFALAETSRHALWQTLMKPLSAEDRERYHAAQSGLRDIYDDIEHHCRAHSRPNFLFNSCNGI